jgi:hypothetical protein
MPGGPVRLGVVKVEKPYQANWGKQNVGTKNAHVMEPTK